MQWIKQVMRLTGLYLLGVSGLHAADMPAAQSCTELFDAMQYEQAIRPCTQAAEANDLPAQTTLGEIYDQQGDAARAHRWWKQAADAGHQPARHLLALKYYYGGSVFGPEPGWPKDQARAFGIWHKDAVQGVAASQFMVGVMYHKGEGVERDLTEAWLWLKLALRNGYKLATDVLIELNREMTPSQKQQAMDKLSRYRQRAI